MATYNYTKPLVDVDALTRESLDEGLPYPAQVSWVQDTQALTMVYSPDLTPAQKTTLDGVVSAHDGQPYDYPDNDIEHYLKRGVTTTDARTGISGPFEIIQPLVNRREIFNDDENPLHVPDFQPIIGPGGWGVEHANRIANLETIHGKLGWHNQQVLEGSYSRPRDMMIFYGWPSGFNAYWNNEAVSKDLARYGLIVLGAGLQDPGHGDYTNCRAIVARVKQLNPSCLIFGYIDTTETLANFQTKTGQWKTVGVHGIFMDKYGYDYGSHRSDQNNRVNYVHGQGMVAFANCWNMDHAVGTANDPSYPNATYNPSLTASSLGINDWYLMESFLVNTDSYTNPPVNYEPKAQWAARAVKMLSLRAGFGINVAASGIILDAQAGGQAMFDYFFTGAMMCSLEGCGVSDTYYGASSGKGKWWTRPDVKGMGKVWTLNPSIQVDPGDSDVYHRQSESARMMIDFSTGAQTSSITKW